MIMAKKFLKYLHSFENYNSICTWFEVAKRDIYNKVMPDSLYVKI